MIRPSSPVQPTQPVPPGTSWMAAHTCPPPLNPTCTTRPLPSVSAATERSRPGAYVQPPKSPFAPTWWSRRITSSPRTMMVCSCPALSRAAAIGESAGNGGSTVADAVSSVYVLPADPETVRDQLVVPCVVTVTEREPRLPTDAPPNPTPSMDFQTVHPAICWTSQLTVTLWPGSTVPGETVKVPDDAATQSSPPPPPTGNACAGTVPNASAAAAPVASARAIRHRETAIPVDRSIPYHGPGGQARRNASSVSHLVMSGSTAGSVW